MQLADAYRVLGVREGCNPDEVRAAYRRLVLTHHPDKGGSQEDFVRITEAYERVAGDKAFDISDMLAKSWDFLREFLRKKELSIKISVEVDMRDVYEGIVKKLGFKRRIAGVSHSDMVFIGLANFKERHVFVGKGDVDPDGLAGDLDVTLKVRMEDEDQYFDPSINNADLHVTKDIRLADHLLGCSFSVTLPNGTSHELNVQPLEERIIVVPSLGFPLGEDTRGDLIVRLQHKFDVRDRTYLQDDDFVQKVRKYLI